MNNQSIVVDFEEVDVLKIVGVFPTIDNALDEADRINNELIDEFVKKNGYRPNSSKEWNEYFSTNNSYGAVIIEDLISMLTTEFCEKLYKAIERIQNGENNVTIKVEFSDYKIESDLDEFDKALAAEAIERLKEPLEYSTQSLEDFWKEIRENAID